MCFRIAFENESPDFNVQNLMDTRTARLAPNGRRLGLRGILVEGHEGMA